MKAFVSRAFRGELEKRFKATGTFDRSHLSVIQIFETDAFPHDQNCIPCSGTGEGRTSTFCLACAGRGRIRQHGYIQNGGWLNPPAAILVEPLGERRFDPSFPAITVPPPPMRGLV